MEPVLIVEDDANFADYLRRGLTYEGYKVRAVASAEEGMAAVRLAEPRAVILDIMLPGIDGFAACRALRQAGYAGPVLMLTARDGIGDRVAGLDSGADDYLPKPFEFDELLARLRALRRRCSNGNGVLTAGDLALDEERLAACRAGRPLSLTRTEFALLAALLRPPRAVRSRDELLTVVWGHDYAGEDKVLDVTISRLRAKLGQPDPIRTLHGVGYLAAGTPTD
ncbi:MAG: response regulator transcription factor [Chloroflexi bacterium]|nr:response regulator transcription factor [Chloroflexota bacterium]